jgi:hypothetical protein
MSPLCVRGNSAAWYRARAAWLSGVLGPLLLVAAWGVAACGASTSAESSQSAPRTAQAVGKEPPASVAAAPSLASTSPGVGASSSEAVDASPSEQAASLPPAASPPAPANPAPANPVPANPAPAEPAAGAAALFARLGDVLVPLACKGTRRWQVGRACLPKDEDAEVSVHLQPPLKGESAQRSASPASIPFVLSGTEEPGLVLVDKERETTAANRPLLGFGVVSSSALVRYTKAGVGRVQREASSWCAASKGACQGISEGELGRLVGRVGRAREQNDLVAQVRQAIAPLAEELPIKVVALFPVSVAGRQQRIADVMVETGLATGPKAAELQLPDSVHFLLTETAHGFRLVGVTREYGFGLGEAGELVAAIDLDADGTDELILSWSYSEGRSWELIRRAGDKLVFVGGFTDGA